MAAVSLDIVGAARIKVGEKQLSPLSPQLFAAALYLVIESGRECSREELQELLFAPTISRSARSHNLRQLLYRLSSIGFPIESRNLTVRVNSAFITAPLAEFEALPRATR